MDHARGAIELLGAAHELFKRGPARPGRLLYHVGGLMVIRIQRAQRLDSRPANPPCWRPRRVLVARSLLLLSLVLQQRPCTQPLHAAVRLRIGAPAPASSGAQLPETCSETRAGMNHAQDLAALRTLAGAGVSGGGRRWQRGAAAGQRGGAVSTRGLDRSAGRHPAGGARGVAAPRPPAGGSSGARPSWLSVRACLQQRRARPRSASAGCGCAYRGHRIFPLVFADECRRVLTTWTPPA